MSDTEFTFNTAKGNPVTVTKLANGVGIQATDENGAKHAFMLLHIDHKAGDYFLVTTAGVRIPVGMADASRAGAMLPVTSPAKKNNVLLWVGGSIAGVFVLITIIGLLAPKDPNAAPTAAAPEAVAEPAKPTLPAIGTAVPGDKTAVIVTRVLTRDKVGANTYAAEGGVLVVVDYKIKNISDKPLKSYDMPTLKLVDPNGTEYEADQGKSGAYSTEVDSDRKLFSDLNPDIAVKDSTVFEVSKTRYDPATWHLESSDGDAKIGLQ